MISNHDPRHVKICCGEEDVKKIRRSPECLFADDLHDARANLTELTRRLHELEIELRRLENEREELTAAYKEAEAVSIYPASMIGYKHNMDSNVPLRSWNTMHCTL